MLPQWSCRQSIPSNLRWHDSLDPEHYLTAGGQRPLDMAGAVAGQYVSVYVFDNAIAVSFLGGSVPNVYEATPTQALPTPSCIRPVYAVGNMGNVTWSSKELDMVLTDRRLVLFFCRSSWVDDTVLPSRQSTEFPF